MTDAETAYLGDLIVFCLGTLDAMKHHGLVEGGCFRLDVNGKKRYAELQAANFRPSKQEIHMALDMIFSPAAQEAAQEMLRAQEKETDQ